MLQVRLPTNFKSARFVSEAHTAFLRKLEADIEAARFEGIELPVKLKVHESVFVPLAKWAMLIAGNYRCVTKDGSARSRTRCTPTSTRRAHVQMVVKLCVSLGAKSRTWSRSRSTQARRRSLGSPSSAARALFAGAPYIERVDRLVQAIAKQKGMQLADPG